MTNFYNNLSGFEVEFEQTDEDKYPPVILTLCNGIEHDDLNERFVSYLEDKIYKRLCEDGNA